MSLGPRTMEEAQPMIAYRLSRHIYILAVLRSFCRRKIGQEGAEQCGFGDSASMRQDWGEFGTKDLERSTTNDSLPPQSPYIYSSCALRFL